MHRSPPKILLPLILMGIVWAALSVWLRHESVILSYQVSRKKEEVKLAQEDILKMRSQLENLTSPEKLEKIARRKFSLARPEKDQIIFLEDPPERL